MNSRGSRSFIHDRASSLHPGWRAGPRRIALYSHDTMGLGHMRRNLLIAQTLMRSHPAPAVLMLAGAREAGALRLPPGVDCLTLPALGKDGHGHLKARHLDVPLAGLKRLRSSVLSAALSEFDPDVLIVDKVPRGALHELIPALESLRADGRCRCVLGLRDILDEPETARREWREAQADEAIHRYYDAVWVYGDPEIYDPVREYGLSSAVAEKVRYTGYLDQRLRLVEGRPEADGPLATLGLPEGPMVLCQLGGGQDGAELAEAFVRAELPEGSHGVLLTGPYLPAEVRARVKEAAASRPRLRVLESITEPGWLLRRADRVIAMGGYNTVCEVLSHEKPALIMPRIHPRREQLIRAERLRALGLIDMLHPDDLTPEALGRWLAGAQTSRPWDRGLFRWDGAENLPRFVDDLFPPFQGHARTSHQKSKESLCLAMTTSASATS